MLWFRGIVRLPAVAVSSLSLLSPLSAAVIGAGAGPVLHGWALAGWLLTLAVCWRAAAQSALPLAPVAEQAMAGIQGQRGPDQAKTHGARSAKRLVV